MKKPEKSDVLAIRLVPEMQAWIRRQARQRKISASEVVRQALQDAMQEDAADDLLQAIDELASHVPEEAWKDVPSDLSSQLDHYIYGTPKR